MLPIVGATLPATSLESGRPIFSHRSISCPADVTEVTDGSTYALQNEDMWAAVQALVVAGVSLLQLTADSAEPAGSHAFAPAGPANEPLKNRSVVVSGSLRTRVESWDWFEGEANNDYVFVASLLRLNFTESRKAFDWQLEMAAPLLLGLPDDAIGPGSQGQLGLGASYFAANRSRNAGMIFAKQAFLRMKALGGVEGQSLKLGRMEVIDGTEVTPKNATLAALKRDRIAHRLLGNFGFSHVGRSFDGAQYAFNRSNLNVTVFGGRPTRGVFQVDGWGELNVNVLYGALTGETGGGANAGEWRVFGAGYSDYRDGVLKTDNRPLAMRRADIEHINIGTYGAHYLHTLSTRPGALDLLFWGALQNGSWGKLAHSAGAMALEAGFQPRIAGRLKPWIRSGYNYGSGDKDPSDATHGTFFQILPTPRIYARMPFFNLMNTRDVFGELVLRPSKALSVRTDVHSLRLAKSTDLWYSGGGAFQPWTFGYTGRPSNGRSGLATLYDASVDYNMNAHASIAAYFGHASGKLVMQSIYPKNADGNFGYLEFSWRF